MDQLRVGIVGCGEVVQIIHLPSLYRLADKFRVTALCDASQVVLDAVGAQWNVSRRYLRYEDLVNDSEVDIVLVANPHVYHAPVTLAAIATGKHVLVEKPAAMNLAECDAVQAAQEQAGVTVQVAYMRRYAGARPRRDRSQRSDHHTHVARRARSGYSPGNVGGRQAVRSRSHCPGDRPRPQRSPERVYADAGA